MARSLKDYGLITLKGLGMGAADVIPGVSGGTIAFITGIYEELLDTIKGVNLDALKMLRKSGLKAFWQAINGNFILALFLGIGISLVSLAKVFEYLLEHHPIQLWSFFFGLIVASVWLVGKQVKSWGVVPIAGIIAGSVAAYFITTITPTQGTDSLWYLFMCGTIAITAMILPGISGSFILLLLGAYQTVLGTLSGIVDALKDGDTSTLGDHGLKLSVFAIGCLVGLLSFSRLLSWMFKKAHDLTIAILTGFLIGSLNKIWPWKENDPASKFIKHEGEPNEEVIYLVQDNVLPGTFGSLEGGQEPHTWTAIGFCALGLVLIVLMGRLAPKEKS